MSDKKSSESRRKLLKSIAAGSGAIVAGKSLPENWAKPVVDSVMLPAHAQTSPPTPTPPPPLGNLASASVTITQSDDGPEDEIALNLENDGSYSLLRNTGVFSNTLVYFDADYDLPDWDYYSNGDNWPTYPSSWSGPSGPPTNTGENNLTPGTYTIESTHSGGNTFRVTFTVDITPTTPNRGRTMTVTLNSVTQI